jgi:hypothetical protein
VRGDRSLVFFAGAGRYYDRSLFIDSALETIKDYYESVATLQTCASNPTLVGCIAGPLPTDPNALRALAATQPTEVHLLNNKMKVPFSDQVNFGVRKRFGVINTSATISYIKSHNIFQIVAGNRLPDGTFLPGDSTVFVYNGDPYSAGIFIPTGAVAQAPFSPQHNPLFIGNSDGKATYAALYLQADKPYTDDTGWGFTTTLTLSRTRTNDTRNRGQIGDPFYFDSPYIGDLGWGTPIGAEKWRFVGTGTVRIPVINAKLSTVVTLSSGPTYGGVLCNVPSSAPGGGGCYPNSFGLYWPHGIGYKNVDFNLSKSFKMPWNPDHQMTVYFQALNAFDFVNRNYSEWTGGFQNVGGPGPSHAHDPGSVASQGRNFKIGARYTF